MRQKATDVDKVPQEQLRELGLVRDREQGLSLIKRKRTGAVPAPDEERSEGGDDLFFEAALAACYEYR